MQDKLSVYSLEELRISLIKKRNNSTFPHLLIVDYNNFFQSALKFNNVNVAEAFLEEFINEYKYAVSQIESFGSDIEYISNILNSLNEIYLFQNLFSPISFLENEIERIEKEISKLKNILDGKDQNVSSERKATFPLIYKNNSNGFYGIIESATINIKKSSSENKFIIIPSEKNIEENILTQCKNSWELALNLSKRFVKKLNDFHEVIISFDKKEGFYEGNSLGMAITFSFLKEILKYYNLTYTVNLIGNIAFTGGVETNGEILNTGKEIIEHKINTLFFSDTKVFVFHKDDEIFARKRLNELNEKYQNRKLKLEPFDNIDSILNRRDLVDIKKQKLIVRSLKFVKKNWVSSVATIVLAILLAFVFVADWDDNPAILDVSANTLFVKNKSGKVLWTKKMNFNTVIMNLRLLKKSALLADINNDAINEVILINEQYSEIYKKNDFTKIVCFDKTKNIVWQYNF
ncbi:MAG: hypothetical protein WAR79_02110 [Melioribacteraceae bacterium]